MPDKEGLPILSDLKDGLRRGGGEERVDQFLARPTPEQVAYITGEQRIGTPADFGYYVDMGTSITSATTMNTARVIPMAWTTREITNE